MIPFNNFFENFIEIINPIFPTIAKRKIKFNWQFTRAKIVNNNCIFISTQISSDLRDLQASWEFFD